MSSQPQSPESKNPNREDDEPRLARLETRMETRLAYLEAAQEDLNTALLAQARTIDAQAEELRHLKAKLAYLEESLPADTPPPEAERPPHY